MSRRVLTEAAFYLLLAIGLAIAVLLVLVMGGRLASEPVPEPEPAALPAAPAEPAEEEAEPAEEEAEPAEEEAEPAEPAMTRSRETAAAETESVPAEPASAGAATVTVVTVRASRGECWVSARRGSETGAVLYEGVVADGQTLTLRAPVVWLRLGAAANVDVVVNGSKRPLPAGTVDVVLDGKPA